MLLIVYLFQADRILNEPFLLIAIKYGLAAVIVLSFCYSRLVKFREYYMRKLRDKIFIVSAILAISIFIIFSQAILAIPINFLIKLYSKNQGTEYYNCKIQNVVTTGIDKVQFIFLDKTYTTHYPVNGYTREELIKKYQAVIGVRKSILNSYYLESIEVREK